MTCKQSRPSTNSALWLALSGICGRVGAPAGLREKVRHHIFSNTLPERCGTNAAVLVKITAAVAQTIKLRATIAPKIDTFLKTKCRAGKHGIVCAK
jgi:hypothetical protein